MFIKWNLSLKEVGIHEHDFTFLKDLYLLDESSLKRPEKQLAHYF